MYVFTSPHAVRNLEENYLCIWNLICPKSSFLVKIICDLAINWSCTTLLRHVTIINYFLISQIPILNLRFMKIRLCSFQVIIKLNLHIIELMLKQKSFVALLFTVIDGKTWSIMVWFMENMKPVKNWLYTGNTYSTYTQCVYRKYYNML